MERERGWIEKEREVEGERGLERQRPGGGEGKSEPSAAWVLTISSPFS